ncbi:hypothetical protein PI87_21705 [Ralstonia sp. A12]|uniref:SDR family NAD(P)-dependent oxidoreductase n=1 Tax=Ralstonia sp. A12 TaxID=1217052 RepID=UPI0005746DB2|nr:SDR family oxidoreductase [Ralstonia sp. A12]KHK51142.1 hypothetical protein PI87_21705 [Ralstonia sp. A12]
MAAKLPLKGQTAFVTAGADGIGTASAAALLRDGATVLLMGRRRDALEHSRQQLRAQIPDANVHICAGDAGRAGDMQAALKQAWWLQSRLDIVVPTLSSAGTRPLLTHDEASLRNALELHVVSAFTAIRLAAPWMARQGGGSIVCIASDTARADFKRLSAHCAASACLDGLVRAAAEELSSAGIRVNAVRADLTQANTTVPTFGASAIRMPLGRPDTPEDIATAVRYLAGPESARVTGQSLAVDGVRALRQRPEPGGAARRLHGETARSGLDNAQLISSR